MWLLKWSVRFSYPITKLSSSRRQMEFSLMLFVPSHYIIISLSYRYHYHYHYLHGVTGREVGVTYHPPREKKRTFYQVFHAIFPSKSQHKPYHPPTPFCTHPFTFQLPVKANLLQKGKLLEERHAYSFIYSFVLSAF